MESKTKEIHWVDYLILVLLMVISMGVGLFQARKNRQTVTKEDYFHGGRALRVIPVCCSVIASFMSSIVIIGGPAETYLYGWATLLLLCSKGVFGPLFTAYCVIPVIYPLKLTSAYEYLEMRFQSRVLRLIGSAIASLDMMIYSSVVAFGAATALEAVSSVPSWISVIVIVLVTTLYTSLGGIKAVIWTDTFQVLVMLAGMMAIQIKGSSMLGYDHVFKTNKAGGRLDVKNFLSLDPFVRYSLFAFIIGGPLTHVIQTYSQPMVQRINSIPTMARAKKSILLSSIGFLLLMVISCVNGFILYAHYATVNCDPLKAGYISNPNQYVTYYVMDTFGFLTGFVGLLLAALFSATISTLSSNINCLTALIWEDVLSKCIYKNLPTQHVTRILKFLAALYGIVITFFGIACIYSKGSILAVALVLRASVGSPLLGLFLLGCLFPWVNWKGALAGVISSLVLNLWIGAGSTMYPNRQALPLAGVEKCISSNISLTFNETFSSYGFSGTTDFPPILYETTSIADSPNSSALPDGSHSTSGIENLYQISYFFIAPMGILTEIIVANVVSFFTGFTDPKTVDECLLLVKPKSLCGRKEKRICHKNEENDLKLDDADTSEKERNT